MSVVVDALKFLLLAVVIGEVAFQLARVGVRLSTKVRERRKG